MMDLQKKFLIEPAEGCPLRKLWKEITLWKDLARLVQKYRIAI